VTTPDFGQVGQETSETQALRRRQRALEALTSGRPLPEVLDQIARSVEAARPGVTCVILRHDRDSGRLQPVAAPSLADPLIQLLIGLPVAPNDGAVSGPAAWLGQRVINEDVVADPRWAAFCANAVDDDIRAACAEPVTATDGTVLGVITMYRCLPGPPDMAESVHLSESARLTALAMTHVAEREAAERQADLFRAGQRLARMGTIHFDMVSGLWTVSPSWADHIGLDDPVMPPDVVRAVVHPHDMDYASAMLARVREEGRAEYDHRLIHRRTGETLYVRAFAEVVYGRTGEPESLVGVVQDITDQTRAMLRLADSEARFRGLFEALPLDIALWRRDGDDFVLDDVNPATERDSKDRIRPLLGMRLSVFYEDCPDLIACVRNCAHDGQTRRLERSYRMRTTGTTRHFALMFASVSPDLVLATADDIEERKAAEAALRETSALLTAGQRMAHMGSYEYDIATERWALSDTWCALSGAREAPVSTEDLLAWIHPEDRTRVAAAFETMLRGETRQMEHRVIHYRTGETRYLRAFGELVRDGDGTPRKLRGLVQDITEEKHRERALTDNLAQMALAERIAGVGSWTLDPATGIVNWSDNVYRIYERDPAMGPPSLDEYATFYQGETLEAIRTVLNGAVQDGQPYEITIPLRMPDGRTKWIHALGKPEAERGPAGHVVHGTLQDITDRRRAEEFRDDIDRIIRHDLRSPIAATMAGVNLLRLSEGLSPDQRETLDMMERANQRQLTLLDTSMTLYRMEAGTYDLSAEDLDLTSIIEEVGAELAHLTVSREAAVHVHTAPTASPRTRGDAWLCRALLSNLIRNALEALPDHGPRVVDVMLDQCAGDVVAAIRNPGAVPEDIRERLFEKYVTSGKTGGTGLGTYSARLMAEAQGGSVALDAREPGYTTITVRLPRANVTASGA